MQESLIELESVSKRFDEFTAVDAIDLQIEAGEFLAIMGSSGCGKTTTLRMIAGLDRPSDGEIRLRGERINELKSWERDTPLVWQNLALFPFLNVIENVEFGLRMRGLRKAERNRRAHEWLDRLGIAEFAHRNIAELSGGQRQRVALARSLVVEPPILLLDEPLSALDANLKVRMQTMLTELQRDIGITFVYVTHSHSEAFAMADRVVIMSQGIIEQIGTPEEIYNRPRNRFVAEFIGGKNIITGTAAGGEPPGSVALESVHGRFQVPLTGETRPPADGAEVAICIGADRLEFSGSGAATSQALACTVIGEEFVGSVVTVYLEAHGGLQLQMQCPYAEWARSRMSIGQSASVSWEPDAAFLLQGN